MRRTFLLVISLFALELLACSPRDFLSRRLAGDLILSSDAFRMQQKVMLQTGVVSSSEYPSPEYLVLQHHGWLTANPSACPPGVAPAPCSDVLLTPAGVEIVRSLVAPEEAAKASLAIPAARRELIAITGVSSQGESADVEFLWRWIPLNEIGAALYSSDLHYQSIVGFRKYDDGWRVAQSSVPSGQTLEDALKNAEPRP